MLLSALRPSRCSILGFLTGLVWLVAARQFVVWSSLPDRLVAPLILPDTDGSAGTLVVLGAGVVGRCAPNLNSFRRVVLGVRLWKAGRASRLLFTGGPAGRPCTVAEAMRRLAREMGVPAEAIIVEGAARSTHENAVLASEVLGSRGADGVVLVTDQLHMRRAVQSFSGAGLAVERASVPITEGHVNNVDMLLAGAREIAALAYYSSQGWLGPTEPPPPTRIDVTMPDRTALGNAANPLGGIVVLGASYAAGWPLTAVGRVPVINKGVAGQVTADLLSRFDADVLQYRPRAVLLWGFINDFFRASPPYESVRVEAVKNLTAMIERAERNGVLPILATEVTVRESDSWKALALGFTGRLLGKESYQRRINREVEEVNQWIEALATTKRIPLLDFRRVLADERGVRRREYTKDDGGHITALGYAALNAYAAPVLEKYFAER